MCAYTGKRGKFALYTSTTQIFVRPMKATLKKPFTWLQIFLYTGIFVGVFRALQISLRHVCANWIPFDCPYYWPISIFDVRFPSIGGYAMAGIVTLAFFLFFRYLEGRRFNIWLCCAIGILLITGVTLIQGVANGLYAPVAAYAQENVYIPYSLVGQEFYHDAITVEDPVDFFRRYNEIQPTLHNHAHTHPPGAVLTYYFLNKLLRDPAFIALFIMIAATIPTIFFFYRILKTEIRDETARYMAFLIVLLPAMQIYYLATLDALIAALLTGTLYLFCFAKGKMAVVGAVAMLTASFLLTFVSLFILPVLAGFELLVKRSLKRSAIVIGGVIAVHLMLYLLTGYDAWHSFREASHYENPHGFMLFVDPWNYLFTRLEDIAELFFFFGPFLAILFFRGLRGLSGLKELMLRPLMVLTLLGIVSLLGMFLVGAWRTGETARACMFLYPYLLFPVAYYLQDSESGAPGRLQLASLVFLQSVGMQMIGDYHW